MMIHIGDLVRLSGKTRHGKNRIREHGDLAEVAHVDGVLNAMKKFCVIHRHGDSWRWIDIPNDDVEVLLLFQTVKSASHPV